MEVANQLAAWGLTGQMNRFGEQCQAAYGAQHAGRRNILLDGCLSGWPRSTSPQPASCAPWAAWHCLPNMFIWLIWPAGWSPPCNLAPSRAPAAKLTHAQRTHWRRDCSESSESHVAVSMQMLCIQRPHPTKPNRGGYQRKRISQHEVCMIKVIMHACTCLNNPPQLLCSNKLAHLCLQQSRNNSALQQGALQHGN